MIYFSFMIYFFVDATIVLARAIYYCGKVELWKKFIVRLFHVHPQDKAVALAWAVY